MRWVTWASLLCASHAAAQSTDSGALAESLFRQGRELLDAERIEEACPKFEESQRLDPALGTLMNLALCHELSGRTAAAWAEYAAAAAMARKAGDAERRAFAEQRVGELEPKLAKLRLSVERPSTELEVHLDDKRLEASAWGMNLPVDPGSHTVRATRPGRREWSKRVRVAEGDTLEIAIPPLASEPATTPPPPEPPAVSEGSTATAKSPQAEASAAPVWAWGALAIGTLGLGVGSYYGLRAHSEKQKIDADCDRQSCGTQAGMDAEAAANRFATYSTVAFTVGLLGVATGSYLFLTNGPQADTAVAIRVSPQTATFHAKVSF